MKSRKKLLVEIRKEKEKQNEIARQRREQFEMQTYYIADLLLCNLANRAGQIETRRIMIEDEDSEHKGILYIDIESGERCSLYPFFSIEKHMITQQPLGIIQNELKYTSLSWNDYKNKKYTIKELRELVDEYHEICEKRNSVD